jgi:4'-phosphopantetheinyl transferase
MRIHRDEVHVWLLDMASCLPRLADLSLLLSTDERTRANRFRFPQHRDRFTVARSMLRLLLSKYATVPPEALRFAYSPTGKPALSARQTQQDIRFNLSHSHNLAVYALALGREVGIDVEQIDCHHACDALAARYFTASEQADLQTLEPDQRVPAFFQLWTCKEAYVKATGQGLSIPLNQFAVSLKAGQASLAETQWHPPDVHRWRLQVLPVNEGYRGAIAVEGLSWQLVQRWMVPTQEGWMIL